MPIEKIINGLKIVRDEKGDIRIKYDTPAGCLWGALPSTMAISDATRISHPYRDRQKPWECYINVDNKKVKLA